MASSAAVSHAFDAKHKTLTVLRCRVAVLGDATVGKTALCRLLSSGDYPKHYVQTSSVDLSTVSLPVNDTTRVELLLSDVPGGVIYNSRDEHASSISTVQAVAIVFDVSSKESFTNAAVWLRRALGAIQKTKKPLGILIGNKTDLREIGRSEVTTAEAQAFADSINFAYFETSPETGKEFQKPFDHIAQQWHAAYMGEVSKAESV